ncbi:hypothetical protein HPB50_020379 [Hyalomma asiaticum]|uniref:Uncharacterized protein n=1 Tax=Hyalomma asiaticum TaxID=266040 RepID=A0ACB7SPP8_HYAAI|nr:hypothetical protein HPB50_020379 [Hyalomma asiaticum]
MDPWFNVRRRPNGNLRPGRVTYRAALASWFLAASIYSKGRWDRKPDVLACRAHEVKAAEAQSYWKCSATPSAFDGGKERANKTTLGGLATLVDRPSGGARLHSGVRPATVGRVKTISTGTPTDKWTTPPPPKSSAAPSEAAAAPA